MTKDKLILILGVLSSGTAGGIGFFIKLSMLDKKNAELKVELQSLYKTKDDLKATIRLALIKVKSKDIDSLSESELQSASKDNKDIEEQLKQLKASYEVNEQLYDSYNKDFLRMQDRLKQAYI